MEQNFPGRIPTAPSPSDQGPRPMSGGSQSGPSRGMSQGGAAQVRGGMYGTQNNPTTKDYSPEQRRLVQQYRQQNAARMANAQQQTKQSGGILGGLFGGKSKQAAQEQAAPQKKSLGQMIFGGGQSKQQKEMSYAERRKENFDSFRGELNTLNKMRKDRMRLNRLEATSKKDFMRSKYAQEGRRLDEKIRHQEKTAREAELQYKYSNRQR